MEEGRRKTERRETETTEQKQRQTRRFSLRIEESETRFEIRPTISIKRYRRSFLSLSLSLRRWISNRASCRRRGKGCGGRETM